MSTQLGRGGKALMDGMNEVQREGRRERETVWGRDPVLMEDVRKPGTTGWLLQIK